MLPDDSSPSAAPTVPEQSTVDTSPAPAELAITVAKLSRLRMFTCNVSSTPETWPLRPAGVHGVKQ
jgi:hypothetical protein